MEHQSRSLVLYSWDSTAIGGWHHRDDWESAPKSFVILCP